MHKRSAYALLAGLMVLAVEPALAADVEACIGVENDVARLACYDRSAGRGVPATIVPAPASPPAPATTSTNATPATPAAAASAAAPLLQATASSGGTTEGVREQTFAERWELDSGTKGGSFKIKPYQPVYLLPVSYRQKVNVDPCSPNPVNCATGFGVGYEHTEAKFQISLKTKAWQNMLGSPMDLWFAYTQQSYWQVYDSRDSRPFRESNFQPETWVTLPLKLGPEWLQWRMVNVGFVHQSNGQTDPLSRSWNRAYATFGFTSGELTLLFKPWWRFAEPAATDNNPDISDYAGRIEFQLVYPFGAHLVSASVRNNLRSDSATPNRTNVMFDWAFPLSGELHGYVQAFYGHGESLQNYNFRNTGLGLGVSLVQWR